MNENQIIKYKFVRDYLAPLLEGIDGAVIWVEFISENGEEFVEIGWGDGYKKRVSVTGDSKLALASDVIKALL